MFYWTAFADYYTSINFDAYQGNHLKLRGGLQGTESMDVFARSNLILDQEVMDVFACPG